MRSAALAMLAVLAAVVMLGAATSTWATISVPTRPVDGVQLPDRTTEYNGAAEHPTSVVAAALGFLTALPLAVIGLADRVGATRAPGRAMRGVATVLATGAVATAGIALAQGVSVQVVTLGGVQATIQGSAAPGIFGLGALVVLLVALAAWRVPRRNAVGAAQPSRYTVEAVRGEVSPTPDDEEPDEWDVAVENMTDVDGATGEQR